MNKIIMCVVLLSSILRAVSFPIDAHYCSRSASQLKNYADELESKESDVKDAESELQSYCGPYGLLAEDELSCGSYGTYRTNYSSAIDEYNSALIDINYGLKSTIRSCQ